MNIPLQLNHFALTELHLSPVTDASQAAKSKESIAFGFGFDKLDDHHHYRLALQVIFFPVSQPDGTVFRIESTIVGFFSLPSECSENEREKLLTSNGLAMLYGALRGALLSVVGCFPPGLRCVLPTINIQEMVATAEVETEAQTKAAEVRKAHPKKAS